VIHTINCFDFPFLSVLDTLTAIQQAPRNPRTMNPTTQNNKSRTRKLRDAPLSGTGPREKLDVLLALDRMLIEVSMRLYNVSQSDQLTMRKHNQHLHNAVRAHLPRLIKRSRRRF
jgi:hypothetical protein